MRPSSSSRVTASARISRSVRSLKFLAIPASRGERLAPELAMVNGQRPSRLFTKTRKPGGAAGLLAKAEYRLVSVNLQRDESGVRGGACRCAHGHRVGS